MTQPPRTYTRKEAWEYALRRMTTERLRAFLAAYRRDFLRDAHRDTPRTVALAEEAIGWMEAELAARAIEEGEE